MPTNEKNLEYDYSEYDYIFGIDFGSTLTKVAYHSFALEDIHIDFKSYPSICMYYCDSENYDDARLNNWGEIAEKCRDGFLDGIYIKNEKTARDRLYFKAVIQYFEELHKEFKKIAGRRSSNRYAMTYPSDWVPEKVAYFRSLVQKVGVIEEEDHPGRLLMYSEGASVLRALKTPKFDGIIKQGYYMVCDIGGSKVKMSLFDVTEPRDTRNNIKDARFREWDVKYMVEPSQLSIRLQNIIKRYELYILSMLSPSVKMFNTDDNIHQDGSFANSERVSGRSDCLGYGEVIDRKKHPGQGKDLNIRRSLRGFAKSIMIHAQDERRKSKESQNPLSLQPQESKDILPELKHYDPKELTSQEGRMPKHIFDLIKNPTELDKSIMKPACHGIVLYLKSILRGVFGDSIEALILTGGSFDSEYLLEVVKDTCNTAGVKSVSLPKQRHVFLSHRYDSVSGAIHMAMDKFVPRADTPKLFLHRNDLINSMLPVIYAFIDYGIKKARVSYIHSQLGQAPNYANTNHIIDWPGQSALERNFPTMDVMLIPGNELDGSKMMISLKEDSDHTHHFLKATQMGAICSKYHTFQKDKNTSSCSLTVQKILKRNLSILM
ncbi:unnamed protein product [Mucor hiemalis]